MGQRPLTVERQPVKRRNYFHLMAQRVLSDVTLITLITLRQLYPKWLYASLVLSIIQLDLGPKLCIYPFIFSPLIILSLHAAVYWSYTSPLAIAGLESNLLITFAVVQNRTMPGRHLKTFSDEHIMNLETSFSHLHLQVSYKI